jgi:alkylated DNA nucleotide flippase Atl1
MLQLPCYRIVACTGEMQEPSKRAAESIVKQQDALVEELTRGHPF